LWATATNSPKGVSASHVIAFLRALQRGGRH
jgi:hypothetical protein